MRAALYYGRQDLRLTSVPEPEPGPGEVKLRVLYNGICGSDLLEYFDGPVTTRSTPHPLTGVQNPVIMGHELCGEVVVLGAGIEDLAVGTLVAVEPVETCGRCLYCGLGQYNHCPSLAIHGYNRAGGGRAHGARSERVRRGGGDPRSHRWPRRRCLDRRGGGSEGLCRDAARHPGRWDRGGGGDPPRARRHPALRPADAGSALDRSGAVGE